METNQEYKNYKKLKERFDFKYKSYNINQILAIKIWFWANGSFFERGFLKNFFRSFNVRKLKDNTSDKILYMACTERKDHTTTFNTIASKVKDDYAVINNCKESDKDTLNISLKNIFLANYLIVRYIGIIRYSPYKLLVMAGCLCKVLNSIDKLNKLSYEHVKRFVAFSAVHEEENIVAQAFRLHGSEVFSLCHGINFIFRNNIPADCVNYENLDVDKVLVWCENNKREYIDYGISEKNIEVAGYPKQIDLRPVTSVKSVKRCLVLLSRFQYEDTNQKLLSILNRYSSEYSFNLKLHPSLNWNKYAEIAANYRMSIVGKDVLLTDCMDADKYDFAIAVNTTSYYEILIAGIPCLRFKDGDVFDLMPGEDSDVFSNADELTRNITWINENLLDRRYAIIRDNLLTYYLGVGVDNYSKILLS